MFGIITQDYTEPFERAIEEKHIFQWDGTSIREQLDAAARVQIRTLLLDISVAPIDQLIVGLRSFRRQRPHTRIIIVATDRKPGDDEIARCVALGIYDIVVVHTEDMEEEQIDDEITDAVREKLNSPISTYADAAKWDGPVSEASTGESTGRKKGRTNTKEIVSEKVVIQERLIGTPIIAVTSAHPGAGGTYCSLQIGKLLSEYGTVAYVELDQIAGFTEEAAQNPTQVNGIDIYRLPSLVELTAKYNYIIVNVGYWPNKIEEVKGEVRRASKAFVAVGSSSWRYRDFSHQVDSLLEVRSDWSLLLQTPSDRQTKEIRKDIVELKWPIFPVPYQPEPFELHEESIQIFEEALQEYLPKRPQKPSFFRRWFSRASLT